MPEATLTVPFEQHQRIWYVVREQHAAGLCPTCKRNHEKTVFCVYPGEVCGWSLDPETGRRVIVCEPHAWDCADDGIDYSIDYRDVPLHDAFETEKLADEEAAKRQERWGG